jgi:hypothetical protein
VAGRGRGGSTDGRIQLELVVTGAEEAKRDVDGFNDSLQEVNEASSETSSALDDIGTAFSAAGIAATAIATAIGTVAAGLAAVQQEFTRQRDVWTGFTGDIGQTRQAMGGMISDIEIMRRGNEMLARGIQLSGRDMRNVFVAAFQQAEQTGADFNQTLDQMIHAIGTGSPEAFRRFGIEAKDAEEALAELEERVGDTTAEAESAEDVWAQFTTAIDNAVTAFFQAMEASGELDRTWSALTDTIGLGENAMDDFATAIREVAILLAAALGESLAAARDQLGSFVRTFAEVRTAIENGDFRGAVRAVGGAVERTNARYGSGFIQGIERRQGELQEALGNRTVENTETRLPRRRGGGGGDDPFSAENMAESMRAESDFFADNSEAILDSYRRQREEREEGEEALHDLATEIHDEQMEQLRERQQLEQEKLEAQFDQLEDIKEKGRQANQELADDAEGVIGPVVQGLTKSLAQVIAGTKSADEAFQGLLASFLEMIAQEAALQAAKEFAEAIASFARYDYAGGAQHIAAGVAYTAVAVAAGAASIAVAPQAAQPASPEQGGGGGNQGAASTVVVNYNGPYISTQGQAEAGRELRGLLNASDRMYGEAA